MGDWRRDTDLRPKVQQSLTMFYEQVTEAAGTTDLDEIVRLLEAARKLPQTADGVPVVPGRDHVYPGGGGSMLQVAVGGWAESFGGQNRTRLEDCYSTREAAEAARGEHD